MYMITVQQPDGTSTSRELIEGRCVVGRLRSRSELVVQDQEVSRAHVAICAEQNGLTIEDLGSSNGTYLEQEGSAERLVIGQKYPLLPDQAVSFGASLLTVTIRHSWEETRIALPTYKPRFVGVLYTDIVSSTAMTAKLGHERATELLEWHNETFRERFKRYGGRESKNTGDGFEALFTSVTDALGCAAACQRALARRNQQDKTGLRLHVRMGVNGGEAPSIRKRVYGMPLILAARVMTKAGASKVFVPAHVPGIVAGSLLQFAPVGSHELKGLDEPVELLEFLWEKDPSIGHADARA